MFMNDPLIPIQQLFISIGLGLIVGLQREWAESPIAGIRSFALVSIMGSICGILLNEIGHGIILIGMSSIIIISLMEKFLSQKNVNFHRGVVTEISLVIIFFVGVLVSMGQILIAASIAGLLTVILHIKLELHQFAAKFTKEEIRSIMQFIAITLVIFPAIPKGSFGPNNLINLTQIWMMIILITGVGLVGVIIHKLKGVTGGSIWVGFIGGLISSTATTINSSRKKTLNEHRYYAIVILTAWMTLFLRVMIELAIVTPLFNLFLPLSIISSLCLFFVLITKNKNHVPLSNQNIEYKPTSIKIAFIFAALYSFFTFIFGNVNDGIGKRELSIIAFISGIFDVDAITLATANLVQKGIIGQKDGKHHLLLALLANHLFKGSIALILGGIHFFKILAIPWIFITIAIIFFILIN